MTHELGPEARALLDAAREGLGPDAAAIRRMRANIDASIAGGAAGASPSASVGAGAGAGGGGGALAGKLGALAVVAALAAVAIVAIGRGRGGEEVVAPGLELPIVEPIVEPRAEAAASAPSREVAAPAAAEPEIEMAPEPEIEMAPLARDAGPKRPPRPPRPPGASPSPRPRADLAREVELVDQAMAALRRGDPTAALAAVRVHAAETAGAGQLAEDAAAIEVEALCRLHDPATAGKLAAFDARWPESAQRSRLTARCR